MNNIQPKELNTSLPFLGGGGDPAQTDIFTFLVPAKAQMLLTHFSNYMRVADWGEVTWRFLRNGVPVPPYETILDQVGISTLPRLVQPVLFQGGDYCQIQIAMSGVSVANDVGIALRYEVK